MSEANQRARIIYLQAVYRESIEDALRYRTALERIIATDRIRVLSIGKPTDGGDGPSARIARQALSSTECAPSEIVEGSQS